MITRTIDIPQFPKPYFCPSKTLFTPPFQFSSSSRHVFTKTFRVRPNSAFFIKPSSLKFRASAASSNSAVPAKTQEEDTESAQLFEVITENFTGCYRKRLFIFYFYFSFGYSILLGSYAFWLLCYVSCQLVR